MISEKVSCDYENIPFVKQVISQYLECSDKINISLLTEGGSDRTFLRINDIEKSYVICLTENIKELEYYINFGVYFLKYGVCVPEFILYSLSDGAVLMEDAGDISLYKKVNSGISEKEMLDLYKNVLSGIFKIQRINPYECSGLMDRPFDYDTLRWETSYFKENLLINCLGYENAEIKVLDNEFESLAKKVLSYPMFPMHRDFQSQNIFLLMDRTVILDFQGARIGHFMYDIASLLKDPYVCMNSSTEEKLLEFYYAMIKENNFFKDDYEVFCYQYKIVALQRLMQALGAFCFLGIKKEKKKFLEFIKPALNSLKSTIEETEGFPRLKEIIGKAIIRFEEK